MSSNSNDANECVVGEEQQKKANIGILSIAAYFPKTYVSQEDLEKFDKVDSGKYTKGLMQDKMGFCTDLEDINSIALTVTKRLIDQSGVSMNDIGYLEVGTETILDKSKSVKTVLMDLFESSGNTDIEAVDTTNACYGGTAALFHALDHCSSSNWDGRLAIVVAADIAVYDKGNARPTGGCGAIAMLIGPNAPIVFDPVRASYMTNIYDFYKPDPASEYPTVDGKLSLQAYITAVDKCYQAYRAKYLKRYPDKEGVSMLDEFDGVLMHSPYCKLVRKAFARLLFNEFNILAKSSSDERVRSMERYKGFFEQVPEEYLSGSYEQWMKPIEKTSLEKVAIQMSEQLYQEKTADSLFLSNQVGNMYTASLYSCLVAYLTGKPVEELVNKPILFFSYGSGMAASMFSARVTKDTQAIRKLLVGIQDVRAKLNERLKVTPEEFTAHLEHRKKTFSLPNRSPTGQPIEASGSADVGQVTVETYLYPGTYYLTSVDGMFRRKYSRFESALNENNNNDANCVLSKKSNHIVMIEHEEQPVKTQS
jgi:hydroxymethylglutaryl-CoA synthase